MAGKRSRKLTIRQLEKKLYAQSTVFVSLSPREYQDLLNHVKRTRRINDGLFVVIAILIAVLFVAGIYFYEVRLQLDKYTFEVWVDGVSSSYTLIDYCTEACAKKVLYYQLTQEMPYSKIYIE